ncbi:MAG: diguanylate cyclase [Acidobacteriota bacterium]
MAERRQRGSRPSRRLPLPGTLRSCALAALLVLHSPFVLALDPTVAVTQCAALTLGLNRELPDGTVTALAQTRDGYLWIGTTEGLARFDGARSTVFTAGNSPGLPSSYVTALEAVSDGSLWIGTANGLSHYRDGSFESFTTRQGLPKDVVLCLEEDARGGLWAGANGGGLARLHGGRLTVLTVADGLPSNTVHTLYRDGEGSLWIGTDAGVSRLSKGRPVLFSSSARLPQQNLSGGQRPYLLEPGGLVPAGDPARAPLAGTAGVNEVLLDRDGNLWCGVQEKATLRFTPSALNRGGSSDPVPGMVVTSLLEDREGGVWLGGPSGVMRFGDPQVLPYGQKQGLPLGALYSVSRGLGDRLWFAGGDSLAVREGGRFRSHPTPGLPAGAGVLCVLEDPGRGLLLGTTGGLYSFRDGCFRPFPGGTALSRTMVLCLYRDGLGRIWAGTRGAGFFLLEKEGARRCAVAGGIPDERIGAFHLARDGALWVGSTAGLTRYDPATGRAITYTTRDGLAADYVLSILEDSRGGVWAASWGGLTRVQGGRLAPLTESRGLWSEVIYQVLDDGRGRLWMSSPQGLFSASFDDLHAAADGSLAAVSCRVFREAEGMATRKCWGTVQPAGCADGAGRLWFATLDGAVCADPARPAIPSPAPAVLLEGVSVDGRAFPSAGPVVAPPGPRRLEASFTAPSFRDASRLSFRYRLEGLEEDWTETGTRRTAYYTNLPAGTFLLRIAAREGDGPWGEGGAALPVTLRPFFYETAWFRGLALLLAALGLWAGFGWRVRRLRARKRQLEALVDERTAQLAEANRELERLANEDGLTRIPNVRFFRARLEAEWRRAFRSEEALSLLLLDVDHFKRFNDRYGHQAGDVCLRQVGALLRERMNRPGDLAARYGGEEFVVLLPATGGPGAERVAEEIRAAVEALGIPHEDSDAATVVTVSLGLATAVPAEGRGPDDLLSDADRALYRAKSLGRNRTAGPASAP